MYFQFLCNCSRLWWYKACKMFSIFMKRTAVSRLWYQYDHGEKKFYTMTDGQWFHQYQENEQPPLTFKNLGGGGGLKKITLPSWKLDLQWKHMYKCMIKKPAYIDKDKTSHHLQHRNFFMDNIALNILCLNFFHLLAQKPNLEEFSICLNNFTHNFHLSESSFTCPRLRVKVG